MFRGREKRGEEKKTLINSARAVKGEEKNKTKINGVASIEQPAHLP